MPLLSSSRTGGVETWTDMACAHLPRHGFEPIVALTDGVGRHDAGAYESLHPDLNTVRLDGCGRNRAGRVAEIRRVIGATRPAAVIPLGVYDAFEAVAGLKAEAGRTARRGAAPRLIARPQGNIAGLYADLFDYAPFVDLAVCPGRLAYEMLTGLGGLPGDRARHIPNGVEPALRITEPSPPDRPLRIGFVGRLSASDKRPQDLIPLADELRRTGVPHRLQIVGDGPLRGRLADAFAGDPQVSLLGAIPRRELYETVYPNLDVLFLASASESFGIVLVEAMRHGVVPVCSEYRGFFTERIVEPGRSGLSFPVGDLTAAAAAIRSLDADRERLSSLSSAAIAAAARFDWSRCFADWAEELRSTLAQRPRSADISPRPTEPPRPTSLRTRLGRRLARFRHPDSEGGWPLFTRNRPPEQLAAIEAEMQRIDAERRAASFERPGDPPAPTRTAEPSAAIGGIT